MEASQTPTRAVSPSFERTDIEQLVRICHIAGLDLLPWQVDVLTPWVARDATGHWAANTLYLSVPRQNGKTEGTFNARAIYGMTVFGEWVVYTSHLQKTSTETFEAMAALFEDGGLSSRIERIKTAIGREEIRLKNGARIKFLARTRAGGRGQHADLLEFDEAQNLTDAQQASFLPVVSASANPQIGYGGTPPDPESDGLAFRRVRARALSDDPRERERICLAEWGVDEIPKDRFDRSLWYQSNPSLGLLITEDAVANEARTMSDDQFARERLGWWSPESTQLPPAIEPAAWRACQIDEAPEPAGDERVACGVKFSSDGDIYSVSMAARSRDEGYCMVECVDRTGTARGVSGLADWINERRDTIATVCIDGRSWTPTLTQRLEERGFPKRAVHVMKTGELCDACGMLLASVEEKAVSHIAQPLLEESVALSPRRPIGRDGWAFGGDDPTPVESCALALWGVMTTKRNPRQVMRVSV